MNASISSIKFFMMLVTLCAVAEISFSQFCEENSEESWSYHGSTNGRQKRKHLFPACGGKQQSPMRLEEGLIERDRNLPKLLFKNYEILIDRAKIVNNGHTVVITPRDGVRRGIIVGGSEFSLQQMHFHWGSVERPGAEHTINHIRYPMEIHFVHKNGQNITAVVGLLVQALRGYNDAFNSIVEVLPEVTHKDESTQLRSRLSLNDLLPENPASFYRYIGSLTTPPCDEGVIWSIMRKTSHIGRYQLDYFLDLFSVRRQDRSPECLLTENYRTPFPFREAFASQ